MKNENIIASSDKKQIFRDGDFTVKMFSKNYSKADVLNEALNMARIEDVGLNTPKIHEVKMQDGKWCIVYDYIEGETLESLMEKNPKKLNEYLNLFVDLQLTVQSKKQTLLTKLRDKMHRKIDETTLDATTRYDLHTRLEGMPRHNKLCHGDFNPSNIIITPDGTPFIIDWAHVTQGNASADAARTYLLFSLAGKNETAKKYLELFSKKSDTAIQYIQKWLPIVAASQSVKSNPSERELLLSWVGVVDYE